MKDEIGVQRAVQSAKQFIQENSRVLSTPVRCDDLHRLFILEKNLGYDEIDLLSLTNDDIHGLVDTTIDTNIDTDVDTNIDTNIDTDNDTPITVTTRTTGGGDNQHLLYQT